MEDKELDEIKAAMLTFEKYKRQAIETIREIIPGDEFVSFVGVLNKEETTNSDSPCIVTFGTSDVGKRLIETLQDLSRQEVNMMILSAGWTHKKFLEWLKVNGVLICLQVLKEMYRAEDGDPEGAYSGRRTEILTKLLRTRMGGIQQQMGQEVLDKCREELFGEDGSTNTSIH